MYRKWARRLLKLNGVVRCLYIYSNIRYDTTSKLDASGAEWITRQCERCELALYTDKKRKH